MSLKSCLLFKSGGFTITPDPIKFLELRTSLFFLVFILIKRSFIEDSFSYVLLIAYADLDTLFSLNSLMTSFLRLCFCNESSSEN